MTQDTLPAVHWKKTSGGTTAYHLPGRKGMTLCHTRIPAGTEPVDVDVARLRAVGCARCYSVMVARGRAGDGGAARRVKEAAGG